MENMSKTLRRVIDSYGFNYEVNGHTVIVSSSIGEIVFRRVGNLRYRVYGCRRRVVFVGELIAMMEDAL